MNQFEEFRSLIAARAAQGWNAIAVLYGIEKTECQIGGVTSLEGDDLYEECENITELLFVVTTPNGVREVPLCPTHLAHMILSAEELIEDVTDSY